MIIAGPCSVQDYKSTLEDALECKKMGIEYFRAGAFKPRTYPTSFQGLGKEGLEILSKVKKETGLKIVSEIVDINHLPWYSDIDILQIGARNCQNFELLKRVAEKSDKPVLLKRGFGMTIDEFVGAADYLTAYGCSEVILCERGIRTFENATRNTLDLACVPLIHKHTNYKIIVDPSHGTGNSDLVLPMAYAALACGADGLMIEMTKNPDNAISDAAQTINYEQMYKLLENINYSKIKNNI